MKYLKFHECGRPGMRGGLSRFLTAFMPALFLVWAVGLEGAGAQEEGGEEGKEGLEKVELPTQKGGAEELVRKIREGMKEIDENLLGATARDVPEKLKDNIRYIEELLNDTRGRSQQVIKDLEELIKNVKYQKSNSGGGQRRQPRQSDPNSQDEENRPRSEQQSDQLERNQANQQQSGQEDKPEDGAPDDQPGLQKEGDPPPPKNPEEVDRVDLSGRWGVLPPKIQKDILNFNIENFPQKYRKWLEEYYRRINRKPNQ